jgi:hypothetical protein
MTRLFTPTTDQVCNGYAHDPEAEYHDPIGYGNEVRRNKAAFNRWLAAERAESIRTALEMCFTNPELSWSFEEISERLNAWADALSPKPSDAGGEMSA